MQNPSDPDRRTGAEDVPADGPSRDEPAPSRDEPAPGRGGRPTRDMAISLAVLLVPLLILFVISRALGSADTVVVDPSTALSEAAAAFPVATPHGPAGEWKTVYATSRTETNGKVLRIGYLTPGGGTLQLIESNEALDGLLIRELGDNTRPTGPVSVTGTDWRSYDVRTDERALVRADPGRTVIVIGRASVAELTALAAAVS